MAVSKAKAADTKKAAPKSVKKAAPKRATEKASPKPASKTKRSATPDEDPSALIDQRIADLGDWRGETLSRMRALILEADPEIVEEWKWGTPVWSRHGIVCTGESYKKTVKLTFAKGASVADPSGLFNSSLEGNTRRAIDIPEGATLPAAAFKALVKAAVAVNASSKT